MKGTIENKDQNLAWKPYCKIHISLSAPVSVRIVDCMKYISWYVWLPSVRTTARNRRQAGKALIILVVNEAYLLRIAWETSVFLHDLILNEYFALVSGILNVISF
jgi:hypothetical protein